MRYELSWLIRSLFFYDSCYSQRMLVTKVRVAALKACSVMNECTSKPMERVWEFYMYVHYCVLFHFSGRFYVT